MGPVNHSFQLLPPHTWKAALPSRLRLSTDGFPSTAWDLMLLSTPGRLKNVVCATQTLLHSATQDLPAWGAVIMWGDDDNLHRDRGPQKVNHLLMA